MVNRKTAALLLASSLAFAISGCWGSDSADSVAETPSVEMQDSSVSDSGEAAGSEKEPMPDENGLVPTDDPNVFKATRVLPKPESSVKAVKPEYPKLGFEHTYEGAEAVALYFQDLLSYAMNSGDVSGLRLICLEHSKYCSAIIEDIEENEREGNWHEGVRNTNTKISKWGVPPEENNVGEYTFIVTATIGDYTYFDRPEMKLEKTKGYAVEAFVNLTYVDGQWKVIAAGSEIK